MTRKSKTKTTTTRRKQLLLRANGSTFRADKNTLTLINPKTNRAIDGGYFLVREDLRRVLRGDSGISGHIGKITTFRHNKTGLSFFIVTENSVGTIDIGCKRFRGSNAKRLRNWALIGIPKADGRLTGEKCIEMI